MHPLFFCIPLLAILSLGCLRADPAPPLGREYFTVARPGLQRIRDVNVITLENGLTVIHRRTTANSLIGLVVFVRMGSAQEDPSLAGQTLLLMRTMTKGTRTRDSETIAEQLGSLGASISPGAGKDFSSLSLRCVRDDLPAALEILADIVFNPVFPNDQFELERQRILAGLRMSEDQLGSFAWRRFESTVYQGHPYANPLDGTPETLARLTPLHVGNTHRDFFVPSNMIVSIVGDIDTSEVRTLLQRHFGQIMLERTPRYQIDKVVAPGGGLHNFTKDSNQGYVIVGHLVCPQGHKDQPAVELASAVLGAGMSSRLFSDLRDRKGLAYSVGSSATFLQNQGSLAVYIGTNPDTINRWFPITDDPRQIASTSNDLWEHLLRLRNEPVTEEELTRAKNYIAGSFLRSHETNLQQATYLGYWHVSGLGVDHDDKYLAGINAVTARDIMRVANKYFLDPTVIVVRPSPARQVFSSPTAPTTIENEPIEP